MRAAAVAALAVAIVAAAVVVTCTHPVRRAIVAGESASGRWSADINTAALAVWLPIALAVLSLVTRRSLGAAHCSGRGHSIVAAAIGTPVSHIAGLAVAGAALSALISAQRSSWARQAVSSALRPLQARDGLVTRGRRHVTAGSPSRIVLDELAQVCAWCGRALAHLLAADEVVGRRLASWAGLAVFGSVVAQATSTAAVALLALTEGRRRSAGGAASACAAVSVCGSARAGVSELCALYAMARCSAATAREECAAAQEQCVCVCVHVQQRALCAKRYAYPLVCSGQECAATAKAGQWGSPAATLASGQPPLALQ
jgi:hypothetical protein